MSMINISISRPHGSVFHFDGEFNSMEDLVHATLSGRNYGWLPHEQAIAFKHIANIIRKDTGNDERAKELGGSYRKVFKGTANDLPVSLTLPKEYRLDVDTASEQQIVNTVAKLISTYVTDLSFARDVQEQYTGSPYDEFLKVNNLPRKENKNESLMQYSQRLLKAVEAVKKPLFVNYKMKAFSSHSQKFVFAAKELQGMKLFFKKGSRNSSAGNCVSCHTAPHFSDFGFHNTGLVQHNYDALHGAGSFKKLVIPNLIKRNKNHNLYLPATAKHPAATSRFRSIAAKNKPSYTDLGLWNIFANPDMPAPQTKLNNILCSQQSSVSRNKCKTKDLLEKTIAAFKTPVLRDLGHSNPYMHTGQFLNLHQVVQFYITSSALSKTNFLRNPGKKLSEINLQEKDIEALVAFLISLNEDYD